MGDVESSEVDGTEKRQASTGITERRRCPNRHICRRSSHTNDEDKSRKGRERERERERLAVDSSHCEKVWLVVVR